MPSFSAMAAHAKIVDLRNLLAQRFPSTPPSAVAQWRTGVSQLDEITGGGLPTSAITEIITPQMSGGSASLIAALLQTAAASRSFTALIDGRDSFDPQPIDNTRLKHLLWVRCACAMEAIKAADLLLRDGNFPLVIVDLVFNPAAELRKIPKTSWYRLQRLVEPVPTACLVMTRSNTVSSAQLKIVLESSRTLRSLESDDAIPSLQLHVQRAHFHGSQMDLV